MSVYNSLPFPWNRFFHVIDMLDVDCSSFEVKKISKIVHRSAFLCLGPSSFTKVEYNSTELHHGGGTGERRRPTLREG